VRRLLAFLKRLLHRSPVWTPPRRAGLMFDAAFTRDSYRQGESFDPLNATLPED
jgi:hypothetical protein